MALSGWCLVNVYPNEDYSANWPEKVVKKNWKQHCRCLKKRYRVCTCRLVCLHSHIERTAPYERMRLQAHASSLVHICAIHNEWFEFLLSISQQELFQFSFDFWWLAHYLLIPKQFAEMYCRISSNRASNREKKKKTSQLTLARTHRVISPVACDRCYITARVWYSMCLRLWVSCDVFSFLFFRQYAHVEAIEKEEDMKKWKKNWSLQAVCSTPVNASKWDGKHILSHLKPFF